MSDRTPHPRFAGRDSRGRWLPAESKAAWKLLHPSRFGWHVTPRHWKKCRECGSPFIGLGGGRGLYCSPTCAQAAAHRRLKTVTSTKSKYGLRGLTHEQRQTLTIVKRPDTRDRMADSWWKLPASGEAILVPINGVIEDRLARILPPASGYRWADLDRALGLGVFDLPGQPKLVIFGPDGKAMLIESNAERVLLAAIELGLNIMAAAIRSKRLSKKLTFAEKLRRSRPPKTKKQKPTVTSVASADAEPKGE